MSRCAYQRGATAFIASRPSTISRGLRVGLFSKKKTTKPEPTGPKPRTVLIVDDDLTITELERGVFQGREWSVKTAYDGAGALLSLSVDKPDLILLDLMLPDIPGEDVIKSIRKIRAPTKVIVVTGRFVTKKDFEQYEGTVAWVLRKPYSIVDLRALVDWFEAGALVTPTLSDVGDV